MAYTINEIVDIYTPTGALLARGHFVDQTETEITVLVSPKEFLALHKHKLALLVMLTSPSMGILPHVCTLESYSASADTEPDAKQTFQVQLHIEEKKETIQRRRDFKIKTTLPAELMLQAPEKGLCSGTIEDISATGILFATEDTLEVGQEFILSFSETRTPIDLYGRIVRIHSKGTPNRYGCQFHDILPAQEELMRQYVFTLEARQRRAEQE